MVAEFVTAQSQALRVAREDDVAVALVQLEKGDEVRLGDDVWRIAETISAGHKFALRAIEAGQPVRRYGAIIGLATGDIALGEHVHSHNLRTALSGEQVYRFVSAAAPSIRTVASAHRFRGYRREDGSAGTRNELWLIPTVGCVGRFGERLARAAEATVRGRIDGVHAFNHPFGCSQLGADLEGTAAVLAALAQNPNAGGVILIGLGCETNQLGGLLDRIPSGRRRRIRAIRAQDEEDEFEAGLAAVRELIEIMARDERRDLPLSALRLGVKCGGSDAMSGLTANPLIGRMADAVVEEGGSAILTEIPEMFGAEGQLLQRAESEEVFDRLAEVVNRFKRYFLDHGEPVSENPSPGNIAGGITTLEEKSLGAVQKGGRTSLADVIDYGHRATRQGLTVLEAPGNDAVSTTALAAAGATLILFSTGRGTPLGSPVPTLKIASNASLAARKPNWIDYDAGAVLTDGIEVAADDLLARIVAVASGARARNEINDERAIAIWKRGVTL